MFGCRCSCNCSEYPGFGLTHLSGYLGQRQQTTVALETSLSRWIFWPGLFQTPFFPMWWSTWPFLRFIWCNCQDITFAYICVAKNDCHVFQIDPMVTDGPKSARPGGDAEEKTCKVKEVTEGRENWWMKHLLHISAWHGSTLIPNLCVVKDQIGKRLMFLISWCLACHILQFKTGVSECPTKLYNACGFSMFLSV